MVKKFSKVGTQTYLEEKFLILTRGLEAYHRRASNEKVMNEAEFDELVENLINHCPEERKEWLEGKLKHANEVNLRKRIKRLIEPFKDLFGNNKKRKKLINWIVDTRNDLTHPNPPLEPKAAKGRDLWILCLKMEILFQFHFLQLIGFSEDEIKSIVNNCSDFKYKMLSS